MLMFTRWALVALLLALSISSIKCLNEGEEFVDEGTYEDSFDEYDFGEEDGEYKQEPPNLPYPSQPSESSGYNYQDVGNYQPQTQIHSQPQGQNYGQSEGSYQLPLKNYVSSPVSYEVPTNNYVAQQVRYESPVNNYQAPPVSYEVPVSNYVAPPVEYVLPRPSYVPPPTEYVVQKTSYVQPPVLPYAPPVYEKPAPPLNYTQVQVPIVASYNKPVIQTYVQQIPYQPPVAKLPYAQGTFAPYTGGQITQYSVADLASIVSFMGYRANHWTLSYYRSSPYRTCPKNVYLAMPGYKDIESAFAFANRQLHTFRNTNINYLNSTAYSFAARHQIFSLLSQTNARSDEEGLLVELVSHYLAERACLTKWDKQRYLPTVTKFLSTSNFPQSHSCSQLYRNKWQSNLKTCAYNKYRTYDGFCNNPYHPYWGKSNVCHIRLLSPDYADGISAPRVSYNPRFPLPNPRSISTYVHNDIPLESPYNLMKMQWGQLINHDITHTALASYDGLVDCCKNPNVRGCWPMMVQGDRFYGGYNVTCLNFMRSGVCPTCQLGPRQQLNKNTAFLDASQVYGNTQEQAMSLRAFRGGLLRTSPGKNGEVLLPITTGQGQEQCSGTCYLAGDSRVNQHPGLTVLQTLLVRSHNQHAQQLAARHPGWTDELLFQEARRLNIALYQMITFNEYLPIVFGPVLSAYYKLTPMRSGNTYFEPQADPTTWNEYSTASCRFGHSQIASTWGLYSKIYGHGQQAHAKEPTFRLKDWFMRPQMLGDGMSQMLLNGLLATKSNAVDPWVTTDVQNYLYKGHKESTGGDLSATNIWRGRDHGIPGYIHYVEYCFNMRVQSWKDLSLFIPYYTLNQLKKIYKVVENIDLFTGGLAERHFPGADIGPTFACINGIQYYHLKFGDRFYFEHGNQPGSFTPPQLDEIRRSGTLARFICQTGYLQAVPQYAFLQPSMYNPLVNCSQFGPMNYNLF